MTTTITVIGAGDSAAILLPPDLLYHLGVREGDTLYVIETSRGLELTAQDPEFTEQMQAAERVMQEDRDALRELAQ